MTQDSFGGVVEAWSEVATVYGGIEPLNGREYFQAQTINESLSVRFRLRWRPDIALDTDMRLVDTANSPEQAYDIQSVIHDKHGRREWVVIANLINDRNA